MADKVRIYDVEVFINYASFVFIDIEDYLPIRNKLEANLITRNEFIIEIKAINKVIFQISSVDGYEVDDTIRLLSYINQGDYLSGFNILGYDNMILSYLAMNYNKFRKVSALNRSLYDLSKSIVETDREIAYKDPYFRLLRGYRNNYKSIDLQRIPALDKVSKSLKQTLINLKWYSIKEYEMPPISDLDKHYYDARFIDYIASWDRYVMYDYLRDLIDYNINDVLGCCELFYFLFEDIQLRFQINEEYGVRVESSSNSAIGDVIFQKLYCEKTGITREEYYARKTYRKSIKISDCIYDIYHFKSKKFQDFYNDLRNVVVSSTTEVNFNVVYDGVTYSIKSGGLHTEDPPGVFLKDDNYIYRDVDGSSYYPVTVINHNIRPQHMGEAYNEIIIGLVNERLEAKKNKQATKSFVLKITLNSNTFGKLGFEYGALFDIKALLQVTINGQLKLLILAERLVAIGCKIISGNTDGLVAKIPKDKEIEYYKVCTDWEKEFNHTVEYTDYDIYIRRDVNNYFAVKKHDGEFNRKKHIKSKGDLNAELYKEELKNGFDKPIIARAIQDYYLFNKPVMDTLLECDDIYDFCTTQNVNRKFSIYAAKVLNGEVIYQKLQRNVRFYISIGGVMLYKSDRTGMVETKENLCSGEYVTVFNEYIPFDNFRDYNIKYSYYHKKCMNIINSIDTNIRATAPGAKKKIRNSLNQLDLFNNNN